MIRQIIPAEEQAVAMTDHTPSRPGRFAALCVAMLLALSPLAAAAQTDRATRGDVIQLHDDVPERYVVQRGDTLWDIAARFLRDPWLWPEVWEINPQIENPHLIFPGDIIYLVWVDGRPVLRLVREPEPGVDRLSPRVRELPLEEAIPIIPLDIIRPFLMRPQVIDRRELDRAPYLMRPVDDSLMSGAGHRVYVRGLPANPPEHWTMVRPGEPYRDPDTRDILGYEAIYIGEVQVERTGDPSTAVLTVSRQEAYIGDKLMPLAGQAIDRSMQPRAPATRVEGKLIRRIGGGDYIGQYHVVALNRGVLHGLEPGHVLAVWRAGEAVRDRANPRLFGGGLVQLPDERIGELLVFRVDKLVSFAVVMRSIEPISAGDWVRNP